jgi:uncharacterized pyridoxamine 5'-phosphate oxidase family protein
MDISDCIRFAMENPVTYVATAEGDQPRVRAFAMWFADETGFYYHTGTMKRVWEQLRKNPRVELCFFSPDIAPAGKTMRVTGKVEILEDRALAARLLAERPWLAGIVSGPDDPKLGIFRVPHGEAQFWTMENNMRERDAPRVKF